MPEVVRSFPRAEASRERSDAAAEIADGSFCDLAQKRLEFAEGHLDWVQIRRVFRQITKRRAASLDRFAYAKNLVRGEIVHDDNVFTLERRSQALPDIGQEHFAGHCAVNDKRRRHSVASQSAYESDRLPVSMRHTAHQPLAARATAVHPHHLGIGGGLVDEHQPGRVKHALFFHPALPCLRYVRALLLRRVQAFFLKVILWRSKKRHTAVRLPAILCLRIAKTTSSSVRSGCSATSVSKKSAYSSNGDMLPPRGLAAERPVSSKHFIHVTAVLALTS